MRNKGSMKWKNENLENPLLQNDKLYNAALDEFAQKSFNEASLNDILKAVKMNKGSFYYRFYDKMDLYLSLFHRVGLGKLEFFHQKQGDKPGPLSNSMEEQVKKFIDNQTKDPTSGLDFFEQISFMVSMGLMYAKTESRYYDFWRKYLGENDHIHHRVKENFNEFTDEAIEGMVMAAKNRGEFRESYSEDFLITTTKLLLYNIDKLISPSMEDEAIRQRVNELIEFLKNGLGNR